MAGTKRTGRTSNGFTDEEKAAMKERARESKARAGREEGLRDVRGKIAAMSAPDRALAERLHALITANAPGLTPRTWYGMPAYAKDDQIVCHFMPAEKFKTRYATFGFSDEANLDEGHMWPVAFAITELTGTEEARITALLKRAIGPRA